MGYTHETQTSVQKMLLEVGVGTYRQEGRRERRERRDDSREGRRRGICERGREV